MPLNNYMLRSSKTDASYGLPPQRGYRKNTLPRAKAPSPKNRRANLAGRGIGSGSISRNIKDNHGWVEFSSTPQKLPSCQRENGRKAFASSGQKLFRGRVFRVSPYYPFSRGICSLNEHTSGYREVVEFYCADLHRWCGS